jgi:hypothetical protein
MVTVRPCLRALFAAILKLFFYYFGEVVRQKYLKFSFSGSQF